MKERVRGIEEALGFAIGEADDDDDDDVDEDDINELNQIGNGTLSLQPLVGTKRGAAQEFNDDYHQTLKKRHKK